MRPLFIGLISGTSMDGVDAALVDCSGDSPRLAAALRAPFPQAIASRLLQAARSQGKCSLQEVAVLDAEVANLFAEAALAVVREANESLSRVEAIGSHGQTLWHAPNGEPPHTVQIGSPARIAAVSGLVTVGDFRTGDMALGGQGAPLAPVFHDWLFRQPGEDRVVVNIGGIANLSVLAADGGLTGFDTGPGNTLLDAWAQEHLGTQFDEDGKWARSGTMQPRLLETLLADEYFETEPPKSTGPEHFNLDWLGHAGAAAASPADVQATLVELTAASIAAAVRTACPRAAVAVCGGGASNGFLMERLAARLWAPRPVSTQEWGIHPDWVEAAGFALLALARLRGEPGNEPSVTGALAAIPLGGVFLPS
ncbi:anhydro-N-acetylmuramic acid kinase [Candidatus Foliamicus sp.]